MNRKILTLLSAAAVVAAAFAMPAFGQVATLTCTPYSSTVAPGVNAMFFFSGGTGTYSVSGGGVTPGTSTNSTFTTSFSGSGSQSFTVTSGGQTANCAVTVASASSSALRCSFNPSSITLGQSTTFTATGGTGAYTWSAADLNFGNATGASFTERYANPGFHTVTVASGGATANCGVLVSPAASTGGTVGLLACSPASQTVSVGQPLVLTATGGTGTYTWSAADLQFTNPNGTSFTVNYANPGVHTVTVASGGAVASCVITAVGASSFPGFPNTGFAPAD